MQKNGILALGAVLALWAAPASAQDTGPQPVLQVPVAPAGSAPVVVSPDSIPTPPTRPTSSSDFDLRNIDNDRAARPRPVPTSRPSPEPVQATPADEPVSAAVNAPTVSERTSVPRSSGLEGEAEPVPASRSTSSPRDDDRATQSVASSPSESDRTAAGDQVGSSVNVQPVDPRQAEASIGKTAETAGYAGLVLSGLAIIGLMVLGAVLLRRRRQDAPFKVPVIERPVVTPRPQAQPSSAAAPSSSAADSGYVTSRIAVRTAPPLRDIRGDGPPPRLREA